MAAAELRSEQVQTAEQQQAAEVQTAEEAAVALVPLRRFTRFAELEAWVQDCTAGQWWDETFPQAVVEVVVQRRSRSATFSAAGVVPGEVGMLWFVDGRGWGLETVLHELAHLAVGPGAGHGARFRDALVVLWRNFAGIEAAAALDGELAASSGDPAGLSDASRGDGPPGGSPRPARRP